MVPVPVSIGVPCPVHVPTADYRIGIRPDVPRRRRWPRCQETTRYRSITVRSGGFGGRTFRSASEKRGVELPGYRQTIGGSPWRPGTARDLSAGYELADDSHPTRQQSRY